VLRLNRRGMVSAASALWGLVGIMLSGIGLALLWRDHGVLVYTLVGLAVVLGAFKGNWVMGWVVDRNVSRIRALPQPDRVWKIYRVRGWAFIVAMMCFGILLRRYSNGFPGHWGSNALGTIDLTVGVALLIGAGRYCRALVTLEA